LPFLFLTASPVGAIFSVTGFEYHTCHNKIARRTSTSSPAVSSPYSLTLSAGEISGTTKIFTEKEGSIKHANKSITTTRAKHIDIQYHLTRSTIEDGEVKFDYCYTTEMLADVLTKVLPLFKVEEFIKLAGLLKLSGLELAVSLWAGRVLEMSMKYVLSTDNSYVIYVVDDIF
jgi:hypothetical protein